MSYGKRPNGYNFRRAQSVKPAKSWEEIQAKEDAKLARAIARTEKALERPKKLAATLGRKERRIERLTEKHGKLLDRQQALQAELAAMPIMAQSVTEYLAERFASLSDVTEALERIKGE